MLNRCSITSSIYQAEFFNIYLRFNLNHFELKYLNISLFSLDPNHPFSPKSFFPSYFWPLSSFNPLVSGLNLFFFLIPHPFHAFRPRFSSFWEKFWVFEFFVKSLG